MICQYPLQVSQPAYFRLQQHFDKPPPTVSSFFFVQLTTYQMPRLGCFLSRREILWAFMWAKDKYNKMIQEEFKSTEDEFVVNQASPVYLRRRCDRCDMLACSRREITEKDLKEWNSAG